jgi:hypothetical protein
MHAVISRLLTAAFLALAVLASPGIARAQSSGIAIIRLTVQDSAGVPIPDADIVLSHGKLGAIEIGRSDAAGRCTFIGQYEHGEYAVSARRIGYVGSSSSFTLNATVASVALVLHHIAPTLDTVRVEANVPRSKDYFLDAASIAASSRVIDNAADALHKLRPNMLGDRARQCPLAQNLWINGRRVFFGKTLAGWSYREHPTVAEGNSSPTGRVVFARPSGGSRGVSIGKYLESIKAEHIADIRYVNCWDTSMPEIGTNDAIYVVLKPGVEWDWQNGSHVADSSAYLASIHQKP